MYSDVVEPMSGCRLPLPNREELDDAGQRTYDSLADPKAGRSGSERPQRYPAAQP